MIVGSIYLDKTKIISSVRDAVCEGFTGKKTDNDPGFRSLPYSSQVTLHKIVPPRLVDAVAERLARHGIKQVKFNHFLTVIYQAYGMIGLDSQIIYIDPDMDRGRVIRRVKNNFGVDIKPSDVMPFVLLHELGHSTGFQTEWGADRFAVDELLQLKEELQSGGFAAECPQSG